MSKTGRNDPCPCGSGKKYKKCCLGQAVIAAVSSAKDSGPGELVVQGYRRFHNDDFAGAAHLWLRAWRALRPSFQQSHTSLASARPLLPLPLDPLNWSGDFEQALQNGSLHDPALIPEGRLYFQEWLEQFSEEPLNRMNTHYALASFTHRAGDVQRSQELLEEMLQLWPDDPWAHIFYADTYLHLDAAPTLHVPFDPERARLSLERAKELSSNRYDREGVQERLDQIEHALPISQTCSCCPH